MATPPVRGLAELNRAMQRLAKEEATKAGRVANRAGAVVLRKAVKNEAPNSPKTTEGETRTRHNAGGTTRTETHGKLVNNVKIKKTKSDKVTRVQNAIYFPGSSYHGVFVQFGSIHNAADPFMLRALQNNEQSIMDAIAKSLHKQLLRRGI